jgi:hypothetical protein
MFPSGYVNFKLYEQGKYYTEIGFGAITWHGLTINSARWAKLPKEVQDGQGTRRQGPARHTGAGDRVAGVGGQRPQVAGPLQREVIPCRFPGRGAARARRRKVVRRRPGTTPRSEV